jgi:CRP/FNR family transcriptional regulator
VLTAEKLTSLNRRSFRKRYPAGQLIAGVMSTEEWCGTILSGAVKLTKSLPDGRHQIVALLFPSDFLGRPFRAASYHAAETATEVELCCYRHRDFERLLTEQVDLKQLFLERTLDAVDAAREWMLLLGRKSAREKVAALLLMIVRRTRPATSACADRRIELPLSRSEMADYLGLRLETVSRQLKLLEAAAVIKRVDRRGLVLLDMGALERISVSDC